MNDKLKKAIEKEDWELVKKLSKEMDKPTTKKRVRTKKNEVRGSKTNQVLVDEEVPKLQLVKANKKPKKEEEDSYSKFKVSQKDIKKPNFVAGPNQFKPNPEDCINDAHIDKLLWTDRQPSKRNRDVVKIKKVTAICNRCSNKFDCEDWEVKKKIAGDDEMEVLCQKCIKKYFGA